MKKGGVRVKERRWMREGGVEEGEDGWRRKRGGRKREGKVQYSIGSMGM